jgi:hypothetical protein
MQCIEVGAQSNRIASRPVVEHADDAGFRESRMHFESERSQFPGDEGPGGLSSKAVSGCA